MKVKVPLALLLILAGLIGYLVGTESGREQREVILMKLGRGGTDDADGDPTTPA